MFNNLNHYVLSGTSAITSVGGNAATTCAVVNAKIIGVAQHSLYRCKPLHPNEEKALPLFCSRVPFVNEEQGGVERLLKLAVPALREVVANAKLETTRLADGKLLLALPALDVVTATWGAEQAFVPNLCQRAGIYPIGQSHIQFGESTSFFELLAESCKALEKGECQFCIVGAVDSYLFKHRLDELDKHWRLRSTKNVDGFIPGEAASFMVIEKLEAAKWRGVRPLASINALGFSDENNAADTGRKSSGVGLTQAIRQALVGITDRVDVIYGDLNGESYRAFEWGITQVRVADQLSVDFSLRHPAECYGDVGVATGALLLTLAADELQTKESLLTPKTVLMFTASHNTGARAAASLHSINE